MRKLLPTWPSGIILTRTNESPIVKSHIFLLTLFLTTSLCTAQDDKSWWKSLFSKDVRDKEEQGAETTEENPTTPAGKQDVGSDSIASGNFENSGEVLWILPEKVVYLNDSIVKNPQTLKGFRVSVFSGTLEEARKVRTEFLSKYPDIPCSVRHNSPNFEVRLGNFRSHDDAWPLHEQMKSFFPFAHIVKDDIDLPELGAP
jgi:hypothetical protein